MDLRQFSLDGTTDRGIEVRIHLRRQTSLDAHLGRAELPSLLRPTDDLFQWQEIALFLAMSAGEGTKATTLDADIGEVDVPVDDVRHHIPDSATQQLVRHERHQEQVMPVRVEQSLTLLDGHLVAGEHPIQDTSDIQ
ncbi:hypothetical protein HRbin27_01797 [bacterium HR27]|nr:hypothetical protein HRbin27_01797 [bacterium HR27]